MESLYLLIPVSVVLVFVVGAFFWWSLHRGQFDDLEGPGYRILMDDDRAELPPDQDGRNGVGAPEDVEAGSRDQSGRP